VVTDLRDDDGDITGFAERREAWDLVYTKQPYPVKYCRTLPPEVP
jgi:hypothetical protein